MNDLDFYEKTKITPKSYKIVLQHADFNPEYFIYYKNKDFLLKRIIQINRNICLQDQDRFIRLLNIFDDKQGMILYSVAYYKFLSIVHNWDGDALSREIVDFLSLLSISTEFKFHNVYKLHNDAMEEQYIKKVGLVVECLKNNKIPYYNTDILIKDVKLTLNPLKLSAEDTLYITDNLYKCAL